MLSRDENSKISGPGRDGTLQKYMWDRDGTGRPARPVLSRPGRDAVPPSRVCRPLPTPSFCTLKNINQSNKI